MGAYIARNLRKNLTEAERRLWGYISRRQYIVDFVNLERKIMEKDRERDRWGIRSYKEEAFIPSPLSPPTRGGEVNKCQGFIAP